MRTLDEIRQNGTEDELEKVSAIEEIEGDISIARRLGSLPVESLEALQITARVLRDELGVE